jgi:hypothetical protein
MILDSLIKYGGEFMPSLKQVAGYGLAQLLRTPMGGFISMGQITEFTVSSMKDLKVRFQTTQKSITSAGYETAAILNIWKQFPIRPTLIEVAGERDGIKRLTA